MRELLAPLVTDNDANIEIAGYAALSLGLVFCGAAEEQCVGVALQVHNRCQNHLRSVCMRSCRAVQQPTSVPVSKSTTLLPPPARRLRLIGLCWGSTMLGARGDTRMTSFDEAM